MSLEPAGTLVRDYTFSTIIAQGEGDTVLGNRVHRPGITRPPHRSEEAFWMTKYPLSHVSVTDKQIMYHFGRDLELNYAHEAGCYLVLVKYYN